MVVAFLRPGSEAVVARALQLMQSVHGRMVAQIPHVFRDAGKHSELQTMLERSVREHSATSEMLVWLCTERADWPELINPELLAALSTQLVAHKFDLQWYFREITNSRTYQAGSTGDVAEALPRWFERARVRPLSAEELADAWRVASGYNEIVALSGK